MNDPYEWMKFYEAAVLETDPVSLPRRIEAAQYAIGQRVIKFNVDDSERREIVRTLNALSVLKRERYRNPVCHQCKDTHDPVTSINGRTFIAKTGLSESRAATHTLCGGMGGRPRFSITRTSQKTTRIPTMRALNLAGRTPLD
jgi:hypothetical protein